MRKILAPLTTLFLAATAAAEPPPDTTVEGVTVRPTEPPSPMMHLLLKGSVETLSARRDRIAQEDRFWLGGLLDSDVPGAALLEMAAGDATMTLTDDEVEAAFRKLCAPGP
jgi:hypothetical protein